MPDPPPVTTIAWRLGHLTVGVLGMRNASHLGSAPVEALLQLYGDLECWQQGVAAFGEEGLQRPMGPADRPYADRPMADLILQTTGS